MKTLEDWVEEPGISPLEPWDGEPSPAREAMMPEIPDEEERLKALELAEQPITTPRTIKEAVDPALRGSMEAIAEVSKETLAQVTGESAPLFHAAITGETVPQAALSLGAGVLGFADRVVTQVQDIVQQLATQGEVDWSAVQALGEAKQELWRYDPSDPGAQVATQFVSAIPFGVKTAFHTLADQFTGSPNIEAGIRTVGDMAELAAFGQVFKTLQAPLRPEVKPPIKPPPEPVTRLRKGGVVPKREVSPEVRELADEIIRKMEEKPVEPAKPEPAPKVFPKLKEPVPEEKIAPLEKIVEEPKVVKEPAERVVETQRKKEVAKREKEAQAEYDRLADEHDRLLKEKKKVEKEELRDLIEEVREEPIKKKLGRPKKAEEELGIREEPTVVTSEGIKADTAEALKGKTPEEAYEIVRDIIEEFEDNPKYRFEDPFELINFREWTDELSGGIVRRLEKEGIIPTPEPPTETLDFGGFQKMYEAVVRGLKGEGKKPLAPRAEEMATKGNIVKQRKSRGRTFPPVYELELEILKNTKVLDETWFHRAFENPIRVMEEAGGERLKSLTIHPYHAAERSFYEAWRMARRNIGRIEKGVSRRSRRRIMAHAISKQKRGKILLKKSGIEKIPELTPKELETYDALRQRYEDLYRRMNQVRRAIGVEEFPKEADYFTFFRDLSIMERMGFRPLQMSNEILGKQFVKIRSRPFQYAKPRKGGIYKLELDPFFVLRNYTQKALRYMHISPLVSKMREYQLTMPEGWKLQNENPVLARAMNDWTNHIAGQKSMWSLPPAVESAMYRVNSNLAAAILGANARSAAIQVTALRNTTTEIGFGYTARGVESLIHPGRRNRAMSYSDVLLQRVYDVTVEDALSSIRRGKIGGMQRWATRAAMKPLQILDHNTAMATWDGAYEFAMKELGLRGGKRSPASKWADDCVTRTQASAMPGDIAPIQRPVVGRFLTLFQTFTINDWNFLMRDVLGRRNVSVSNSKAFVKTMRYVAATTMFNILFEDVLHINSPFPTPLRAFKESVDRGDDWPSLAVNVGSEFIEPIPMIGAARYGKGPVGPAVELMQESVKFLKQDPMARPGSELLGQWIGLPGTAQYGKMKRAEERGETPYGQIMGSYTVGRSRARPARPTRGRRPSR